MQNLIGSRMKVVETKPHAERAPILWMHEAIRICLRIGLYSEELIKQLRNIRCLSTVSRRKDNKDITVLSCADAIAAAIEEALNKNCKSVGIVHINRCPDCGQPLRREKGCNVCDNCWYTKCG